MNKCNFPISSTRNSDVIHFSINWSRFPGTQGTLFRFFSMKRQPLEKTPLTHFSAPSTPSEMNIWKRRKNINFCLWWHFVWNRKYAGEIRKGRVPLLRWFTHPMFHWTRACAFPGKRKIPHRAQYTKIIDYQWMIKKTKVLGLEMADNGLCEQGNFREEKFNSEILFIHII